MRICEGVTLHNWGDKLQLIPIPGLMSMIWWAPSSAQYPCYLPPCPLKRYRKGNLRRLSQPGTTP
eukprot:scaffold3228_cov384-Prasinococcus_capsulatus_cf.AAC.9